MGRLGGGGGVEWCGVAVAESWWWCGCVGGWVMVGGGVLGGC